MSAAADFDVSSWLNGAGVDKHHHHFPSSSLPSDSFYPTLSIHVPETKTFDHQLGLFSPLIINNESQSMTLQTPTGPPPSGPFLFQNDTIKMENDGNHEQNTTNNLPVFDHGLTINGSTQISSTTAPSTLDPLSSHLSPLSDASSPSDFEVDRYHPISPLSPSISGNGDNHDYQSVDQLFDDDEQPSPATSPDSPASSEISAFSDFARTNNPNTSDAPSTISTTTDNNQQPKSTKSMNGGKKKRTKRRNLLNALKEHLASTNNHSGGSNGEEGTSESDSELMHELTNRSTRTRGKRSASSVAADGGDGGDDDKDDPNSKRERNKQSASAYRKRRKMYLDTLENKVEVLNDKLTEQQQAMAKMENENKVLREQVSFLKRLISFKTANSEEETKETDDSSMHISSSSSSSYSSGGFGATNSRLNLLNYSTAGTKNAGMFLFLLFSCFLLFNPMWSNDLSITTNDGSSVDPVGRMSRKLLSYEDFNDPLHAAPSIKKEDYMQQYFYGFSTQSTDTIIHPELSAPSSSAAAPSKNNQSTTDSVSSSPSSSSSSSSSSSRYPLTDVSDEARSKALAELHSLAASFHMDPQSQQFAELVAASYLPLVNILGEAATRAALQELATGVFFLQHQTMLTAITAASDNKRNNSTSVLQ